MKRQLFILFLLAAALLCNAERWYFVQSLLRPAAVTFPATVEDVLIVNNAPLQSPLIGHQRIDYGRASSQRIEGDSVSVYCVWGMHESLNESGFFQSVSLLDKSVHHNVERYSTVSRLSAAQVDSLCSLYGVDALIVLNRITEKDTRTSEMGVDADVYGSRVYYASVDVITATEWEVRYPHTSGAAKFNSSDTIYWEHEGSLESVENNVPDTEWAVCSAALNAGFRAATNLVPQWAEEDRYLFDYKHILASGVQYVTYRRWQDAIDTWKPLMEHNKPIVQAYAHANTAVCREMLNDLEGALNEARAAQQLLARINKQEAYTASEIMALYISQLEKIIASESLLKKQLAAE